jgi:PAS domain-containing protein
LEPALQEQTKTGRFRGELRLLRRDGAPFPAEVSIGGYPDEAGGDRLCIVFRDVTERKREEDELRRSEAQFRVMVENALDLITLCNPDNTFRYVNPAWPRALGYRAEELLGTVISDLIHPEDLEGYGEKIIQEIQNSSVSYGPQKARSPMEARWRCGGFSSAIRSHKSATWSMRLALSPDKVTNTSNPRGLREKGG